MNKYNTDIRQALKWQHNKAPNIQSLFTQKAGWLDRYSDQFWKNWHRDVFTIDTASSFGIMIWCIILGVPSGLFGLYPITSAWAFGKSRENFIFSNKPPLANPPNTQGGNFMGGDQLTVMSLDEARLILKLRYAALTSDGRVENINRMLNYIFNGQEAPDYSTSRYAYLIDMESAAGTTLPTVYYLFPTNPELGFQPWCGLVCIPSTAPRTNLIGSNTYPAKELIHLNLTQSACVSPDPSGQFNAISFMTKNIGTFRIETKPEMIGNLKPKTRYAWTCFVHQNIFSNVGQVRIMMDRTNPIDGTSTGYATMNLEDGVITATVTPFNAMGVATPNPLNNNWAKFMVQFVTKDTSDPAELIPKFILEFNVAPNTSEDGMGIDIFCPQLEEITAEQQNPYSGKYGYAWPILQNYDGTPSRQIQTDFVISDEAKFVLYSQKDSVTGIVKEYAVPPNIRFQWLGMWDGYPLPPTQPSFLPVTPDTDGTTRAFTPAKPAGWTPNTIPMFKMEYHIGGGYNLSANFINLLNEVEYGIMPTCAGISYKAILDLDSQVVVIHDHPQPEQEA